MRKKEMIAMLLAGGQGSRLGVLTAKVAKPAVAFGGKYRIIEELRFYLLMRRVATANGIPVRRMRYTRIWIIWRPLIRTMY